MRFSVLISALTAAILLPAVALAAQAPEWAFPDENVGLKPPPDVVAAEPGRAGRMPSDEKAPFIIRQGKDGGVRACDGCHFVNGLGEPQTSALAGLSPAYFLQTMTDFRSGARKGPRAGNMITMAKAMTDDEIKSIANYYVTLKPHSWVKVVEAATAPKTYVADNHVRRLWPGGGEEALGERVIEHAIDYTTLRTADSPGHIAYVPVGSVAEGKALVKNGGGKTIACTSCHGANLTGTDTVPGLAGRSPVYSARQIYMYQDGDRAGTGGAIMKGIVANLKDHDIVAIVAYLATLPPT